MFEFEFTMDNDVFYVSHETNTIDIELIHFLNSIDFEWDKIKSFTIKKL